MYNFTPPPLKRGKKKTKGAKIVIKGHADLLDPLKCEINCYGLLVHCSSHLPKPPNYLANLYLFILQHLAQIPVHSGLDKVLCIY